MKKVIIFLSILLVSCRSSKETNIENYSSYQKEISTLERILNESIKEVSFYKDSLQYIKSLNERDRYIGIDSISELETSYAKSKASISNGILSHILENKDSIPVIKTIEYKEKNVYVTDTIKVIDSVIVYVDKEIFTEKIIEKRMSWSDKLLLIIMLGIILKFIYDKIKNKIKIF